MPHPQPEALQAEAPLLVERRSSTLVITLNRPDARNAATRGMAVALAAALDELDGDDALTAGILTGAGGNFCAGMDLKAFLAGETPMLEGRGFLGLTDRPPTKPLIAAVEGYALAGGFEAVLACDVVVAAADSRFGLPETKRGLVAAAGGLMRLPDLIAPNVAMELALTGEMIDADRAHTLGLVNRVTPPGGSLIGALAMAGAISANGPLAVRTSKQVITASREWPVADRPGNQAAYVSPVFDSADAREGASAFAEKRAPRWSGR